MIIVYEQVLVLGLMHDNVWSFVYKSRIHMWTPVNSTDKIF